MKKILIVCLLCISVIKVFAQTIYLNMDSTVLTKQEFKLKSKQPNTGVFQYERLTGSFQRLHKLIDSASMNTAERDQLYSYLSDISGQQLNRTLPVVAFYHPAQDRDKTSGIPNIVSAKEWRASQIHDMNKIRKGQTMEVYADTAHVKFLYPNIPAYLDKDHVFYKFFPKSYGILMLSPESKFVLIPGEYSEEYFLKAYKALKPAKP